MEDLAGGVAGREIGAGTPGLHCAGAGSWPSSNFNVLDTLYVLPTWGAFRRGHPRRWQILCANLLLGWTVVGWFACLFWAIGPHRAGSGGR